MAPTEAGGAVVAAVQVAPEGGTSRGMSKFDLVTGMEPVPGLCGV